MQLSLQRTYNTSFFKNGLKLKGCNYLAGHKVYCLHDSPYFSKST